MKLYALTLLFGTFAAEQAFAQIAPGKIEIKQGLGTTYYQYGEKLKPRDLVDITMINDAAYKEMQTAKSNYTISQVFGIPGGFLVGFPLGAAIAGGDPNWAMAGIGAGLIVVSIPFTSAYNKHAKEAVRLYNEGLEPKKLSQTEVNLGATPYGLGLNVRF